jgi:regulator of sigma E protease
VWKRALIVLAGPVTNFLFAIAILAAFAFAYGQEQTPSVVGQVEPGRPAATAGLQAGDRIVEIDGRPMHVFEDILPAIGYNLGKPANLLVERGDTRFALTLKPEIITETDRFGNKSERAILGIRSGRPIAVPVGPLEAIGHAANQTIGIVRMTASVLGQFVTGDRSIKEMGGPVKIAKTSGEMASLGIQQLIFFAAFISINLGFINLLPLPMLDGGHLLFYGYEAVRRRPAPPQAQEWAFRFGFAAIVTLMLVVTFNDLGSIGVWDGIARLIG